MKKKGGTDDIELVTSSEDDDTKGIAQYYGLAYGDYYLVEVEAPVKDGKAYNMLTKPQLIHVDANSYTTDKVIVNRSGTTLPETGGMTTIGFTVVGIVFIIVAIVMFTKKDKKDKKDEKSSK